MKRIVEITVALALFPVLVLAAGVLTIVSVGRR